MSINSVKKIYLIGGASIYIYPNNTGAFFYNGNKLKPFKFDIQSNNKLFIDLKNKFNIELKHLIGIEIFQLDEQLNNQMLPFWEICSEEGNPILKDSIQDWNKLSYSSFKEKNGLLWDLSSKISSQLSNIKHSIHNLACLYSTKLDSKIELNDFEVNEAFENSYTYPIYYQFQHILMDCTILRDYLSEFIYLFILKGTEKNIDSMGRLLKFINDKNSDFEKYLFKITKKGGWLNQLGSYRDLVVHSAPLLSAKTRLFAESKEVKLNQNFSIPIIKCPIPNNPHDIRKVRNQDDFKIFENRLEHYMTDLNNPHTKDCLSYSKELFNNINSLCNEVIKFSPIEPKMLTITDKDIIGEIKVNNV